MGVVFKRIITADQTLNRIQDAVDDALRQISPPSTPEPTPQTPKQVEIGSAQTANGGYSSSSFGDPTSQPTITFTASASAKYRISITFPAYNANAAGFSVYRINNSSGSATVNFSQEVAHDGIAGGFVSTLTPYMIVTLNSGTSYTFTLQCKTAAGSIVINSAALASGIALIAEQLE